ncbi:MAG TPA: hypothetical protein PLN61_17275 [bacterium]|nr:hypothetical protein [bacterium]
MAKPKKTVDQIIAAITGSRGIKVLIAKKLGVNRQTVTNYIEKYKTVADAYDSEINSFGDVVEMVIITDIETNRSVETAKWYAKNKLKDRGYTERQEYDHSGSVAAPATFLEWMKIEAERADKK